MGYVTKKTTAAAAVVGALLATAVPTPVRALDVDPGDYVAAAPGTSLAILYGLFGWNNSFTPKSGKEIENSDLNSQIGILRLVHYVDVFGITVDPQIFLPWGALNNGKLGGESLRSAFGFGDIIVAATAWFVNQPEEKRWLGFTPFIFFPTGQYDRDQVLNIGENRFKYVLQLGFVQGFGDDWMVDVIADTTFYDDNDEAGAEGRQTLRQDNSYQFQTWLRYFIEPTWSVGAGYSGTWGGTSELGGDNTDQATRSQQLRLITQYYPEPTLQLQGSVTTDVWARGGFQEQFGLNLRLMKIF